MESITDRDSWAFEGSNLYDCIDYATTRLPLKSPPQNTCKKSKTNSHRVVCREMCSRSAESLKRLSVEPRKNFELYSHIKNRLQPQSHEQKKPKESKFSKQNFIDHSCSEHREDEDSKKYIVQEDIVKEHLQKQLINRDAIERSQSDLYCHFFKPSNLNQHSDCLILKLLDFEGLDQGNRAIQILITSADYLLNLTPSVTDLRSLLSDINWLKMGVFLSVVMFFFLWGFTNAVQMQMCICEFLNCPPREDEVDRAMNYISDLINNISERVQNLKYKKV